MAPIPVEVIGGEFPISICHLAGSQFWIKFLLPMKP